MNIEKQAFDLGVSKQEIPQYIIDNLSHELFPWQKQALMLFLTNEAIRRKSQCQAPLHLMFNMATGTGKTLLMAALMLYYYKLGRRKFMFVNNQKNIVGKTEMNFVAKFHDKYLFSERIVIDNHEVKVRKVDNFTKQPEDIELKFSTIQKLHNDVHVSCENQATLHDLNSTDIVIFADEAHHLNAQTKKQGELQLTALTARSSTEKVERAGWENTLIDLIFRKGYNSINNDNVLLEFTATVPNSMDVYQKYKNNTIFRFGMKDFMVAGYTKEINLLASPLNQDQRTCQALLFQWYRQAVASEHGIKHFKPVALFRSRSINDSWSDYTNFLKMVDSISSKNFKYLDNIPDNDNPDIEINQDNHSRLLMILKYIKKKQISYSEIAYWIKNNYQSNNVIITNTKTTQSAYEITDERTNYLLNSLENKNNHIRAIFTVNRLTEGWDVLNLFDIIRLYKSDGGDKQFKGTSDATISEKQLIGRGIRYWPFDYSNKNRFQRKFDNDVGHDLRILEELYYHTYDEESKYITQLSEELRKDGLIDKNKIKKSFAIKDKFKRTPFYKNQKILINRRIKNPSIKIKSLTKIVNQLDVEPWYVGKRWEEQHIDLNQGVLRKDISKSEYLTFDSFIHLKDIGRQIFRKAVHIISTPINSIYRFDNLSQILQIKSIDSLLNATKLGNQKIMFRLDEDQSVKDISNGDKLNALIKFLDKFGVALLKAVKPTVGTEFSSVKFNQIFNNAKIKSVVENESSIDLSKELINQDWYVMDGFTGTSEEIAFMRFLRHRINDLKQQYQEVYLLRNEEVYTLYDFDDGRGFQPDFLLFLKTTNGIIKVRQVFIESKGGQFLGSDRTFETGIESWKQDLITKKIYKKGRNVFKEHDVTYELMGLPFFNDQPRHKGKFISEFNKLHPDNGLFSLKMNNTRK